jgi:hypothetical protein
LAAQHSRFTGLVGIALAQPTTSAHPNADIRVLQGWEEHPDLVKLLINGESQAKACLMSLVTSGPDQTSRGTADVDDPSKGLVGWLERNSMTPWWGEEREREREREMGREE